MNETTISANKMGWILSAVMGGLLVWMLAGCADNRDQARYRGGYYPNQPQPRQVYAQPSSVTVEASNGSVGFAIRTDSDFYEPLSPYGRWEVVGSYGRCWIPGRVDPHWRPYSNGYWQSTDAGWYWVSDEPWGWATYHYGRWDSSPQFGWYWVPQTQWAPSWVSWRQGNGYVGWAPLSPSARFERNSFVEANQSTIAPRYVFVEERQFLQPVRPTTVIVNNTTIINKTVNNTKTHIVNNTVINEGPSTTVIEQVSGQKIQAVPVRELRRKQEAAIVTQTRTAPPGQAKKAQPPVRTEVTPPEAGESRNTTAPPAAHEVRQVERPPVTTDAPEAPAVKKVAYETEVQKRATPSTVPEEVNPAPQEKKHEMDSEKGKHEGERPAAAKEPTETKAQEHADKQDEKRADKSEKKAQQDSEHKGKKDQPATKQDRTNTVNEVHEKKAE